ncbi:hypothetical protein QYE76_040393 [Lolium multiflorum]|uniref:DUF6598 domain-containing protein n=1 Tax=Lolium multiflorum TaxID=4521 RepID=A0AAD8WT23_LOLMU|nr:hypothetical protein QYE76_040393 [Lolium multiflorum]
MQIPHPILRLLRRPGVAASHHPMHRLSSTSHPALTSMASAPPCLLTPTLAPRVSPFIVAPSPPVRCVSQIAAKDPDDVIPMELEKLAKGRHRDGSIYRASHSWKRYYKVADRNETRLPDPTDCVFYDGTCIRHIPTRLLQIFSLKLAELSGNLGSVELYGNVALRDHMDPLLNYLVNISRNDPIIVKQGSLINMTGPKRGIDLYGTALVEYDMRCKTTCGDLQLIDGISAIDDLWGTWNRAFTKRVYGDCGSVDITVSRIDDAVQATIEVVISEVQSTVSICVSLVL